MSDHVYHGGIKLTTECMHCMGRGQLQSYGFQETVTFPIEPLSYKVNTINRVIIMCEDCEGRGIVMNHEVWMKFKMVNTPDVVFLAEQFLNVHMKPDYYL